MSELRSCPFCNGKAKAYTYLGKFYVRCNKCKAYTAPYNTKEEAIAAWNGTKGQWLASTHKFSYRQYRCSNCGCEEYSQINRNGEYAPFNFCPECGFFNQPYKEDHNGENK